LKICEYENVRCPFCQESEKLSDMAIESFDPKSPYVGLGPWHVIRCEKCAGEFAIACLD